MSCPLRPLSDHVIIKPRIETATPAGLIIPDSVKQNKTDRGTVLAVGPGRELDSGQRSVMDVSVGEDVLFSRYGNDEIEHDGEVYLVVAITSIKSGFTATTPSDTVTSA